MQAASGRLNHLARHVDARNSLGDREWGRGRVGARVRKGTGRDSASRFYNSWFAVMR